ncbi:MAG: RNA polymerase sigma factor RpoD/SigA [Candidatus Bipolaricaulota bacterium]
MANDEEQEILAEKTEKGSGPSILSIYYREIARFPVLDREEEQALGRQAVAGVASARERLILSHLRLVAKIAQEYAETGVPILDLIQEGNIGLIQGVDRFDPERGYRLGTYASWWIRRSILAAIGNYTRMVRIPDYLFRAVRRMAQIRALGDSPDDGTREVMESTGLSADRLQQIEKQVSEVTSLDRVGGDDAEGPLEERVEDTAALSPEREALRLLFREELNDILNKLPARQAFALRLHYGIEDGCPYNLAEVGRIMDVGRERARQLVKEGMDHLVDRWGERALDAYRTLLKE